MTHGACTPHTFQMRSVPEAGSDDPEMSDTLEKFLAVKQVLRLQEPAPPQISVLDPKVFQVRQLRCQASQHGASLRPRPQVHTVRSAPTKAV